MWIPNIPEMVFLVATKLEADNWESCSIEYQIPKGSAKIGNLVPKIT